MKTANIALTAMILISSGSLLTQSTPFAPKVVQASEDFKEPAPLAVTGPGATKEVTPADIPADIMPVNENPVPEAVLPSEPPQPKIPHNALLPGENAYQWMDRMQAEYGVYAYPGTQFFVAPSTPCPQSYASGCTEQWMNMDGTPTHTRIKLHMAEASIGNVYVLFHEIGHTQGIIDECQADIYSRNVTGIPGGFYC